MPARIPGGRDGRRMLLVTLVDRVGSGLWATTSVLYFTFVADLSVGQVGAVVATAGAVGLVSAPLAGRLADRLPLTRVLAGSQVMRAAGSLGLLASTHHVAALLACSAVGGFGDRAANVLTGLYAARVAGPERVRYRAIDRTVSNVGWAFGGLCAASALTVGTTTVYRLLLLADAVSFLAIAALTLRCGNPARPAVATGTGAGGRSGPSASPWRDRTYLAFVATESLLFLDDAVFRVGLPLWAVHATDAPHGLVPLLLVVNNALVVGLQVPFARFGATTRAARRLLLPLSVVFAAAGAVTAAASGGGTVRASACLLAAAGAFSLAEILHSTVSWELSVALAPVRAQGGYLGVHGLARATQRAVGPVAVTTATAAGPLGWLLLGAAIATAGLTQHRLVRSRVAGPAVAAATAPAPPPEHLPATATGTG